MQIMIMTIIEKYSNDILASVEQNWEYQQTEREKEKFTDRGIVAGREVFTTVVTGSH